MKNYFDRFDFGRTKFEFKDLLSDMKHSTDNMLFKKDKFDLGMEKFKSNEPLPNLKSGMDDTLFKKDNLDFGRDKLKFENPLLEMNRRMDFMNFRDRFKIDKPHPDILNNLDRPILKPDLREFNRTLESQKNLGKPYNPEPLKPVFDPVKPVPPGVDMRSFHSTLKSQINHNNPNPIDDLDRRLPPRQENFLGRDIDFRPFDIMFEAAKKVT